MELISLQNKTNSLPRKSDGNVFLADRKGDIHRITVGAKNKFYHEHEWHNFNGDGPKDISTCV